MGEKKTFSGCFKIQALIGEVQSWCLVVFFFKTGCLDVFNIGSSLEKSAPHIRILMIGSSRQVGASIKKCSRKNRGADVKETIFFFWHILISRVPSFFGTKTCRSTQCVMNEGVGAGTAVREASNLRPSFPIQ